MEHITKFFSTFKICWYSTVRSSKSLGCSSLGVSSFSISLRTAMLAWTTSSSLWSFVSCSGVSWIFCRDSDDVCKATLGVADPCGLDDRGRTGVAAASTPTSGSWVCNTQNISYMKYNIIMIKLKIIITCIMWRKTNPLRCVNRSHCVQICHGKFNTLLFKVTVNLNDPKQVRLAAECISPTLNKAQNFFLDCSWWIIFWSFIKTAVKSESTMALWEHEYRL